MTTTYEESALILTCPQAEQAVGRHRLALDVAARYGVPAHVTVTYPFKPVVDLDDADHDVLEWLVGAFAPFVLSASRTDWFADTVLFVALDDPRPVTALTEAVTRAFPDFPPYGGVHDEVVPHLTVGHDQPREVLAAAEREVRPWLPLAFEVAQVELWSGPPVDGSARGTWRRVGAYPLGAGA